MDLRVVAVFWTWHSLPSSFQGFWVVFCVRGVWVSESVFSFLDHVFTSVDIQGQLGR